MAKRSFMAGDDLDRLMAVMVTAFQPDYNEAWSRAQVSDALLIGNCDYQLIAANGSNPNDGEPAAGFALLRTVLDEQELLLFAVDPDVRGQGLGTKLLERVKADAKLRGIKRIFLEMREGNNAATLYLAQNFQRVGLRPKYYRDRGGAFIDAVTFACNLD